MKIFISSDIEGTAGIVNWKETEPGDQYVYFSGQMTREVAAASRGAVSAGASEILVRDAHDSARNLNPAAMPRQVRILRGWTKGPASMMDGLDETFEAAAMTGYHTCAGSDGSPLAHTMNLGVEQAVLNGRLCSEFVLNALYAAYRAVPVIFLSGDERICEMAQEWCPSMITVATCQGIGGGSVGMHPEEAAERIEDGMARALRRLKEEKAAGSVLTGRVALPKHFVLEVRYREHARAYRASFYPGAAKTDAKTVRYEADDYMDVLRFALFCL